MKIYVIAYVKVPSSHCPAHGNVLPAKKISNKNHSNAFYLINQFFRAEE